MWFYCGHMTTTTKTPRITATTPTLAALTTTLTTGQIREIQAEASAAGDCAMVRICRRAADGSRRARREVARVMLAAHAMRD